MNESIFDEVAADLAREGRRIESGVQHAGQDARQEVRRGWHAARAVFGQGHYHGPSTTENVPEETPMSIVTDAVAKVEEGVTNMESWFTDFKPHVETIVSEVQKIEGSPATQAVLKAVEDAGVPDEWIGLVTDFIAKIGQVAASPSTAAPAADAAAPAEAAAPAA